MILPGLKRLRTFFATSNLPRLAAFSNRRPQVDELDQLDEMIIHAQADLSLIWHARKKSARRGARPSCD